jgi:N-acetylmuramoyl-L-alanine amidase
MSKVFIDPGHGGRDNGAVSYGFVEKNINLFVANHLRELLIDSNINVEMSRDRDMDISLMARCNMANESDADIFISVHHNAGEGDGWEIIHSMMSGKKEQSFKLAQYIGDEFTKIGQNPRKTSIYSRESMNYPGNDYFTVLRYSNMPCIITEFAFIDSNDRFIIDTEEELKKEAEAIFTGICNYFGIKDNGNQEHWAEKYFIYLNKIGVKIHEKRYDDYLTRGELFAALARSLGYKEGG